jgi:poly-gamma-glutamate capsule biosynthesis protein CapA/YwtB (metallophosphatase superfamily)
MPLRLFLVLFLFTSACSPSQNQPAELLPTLEKKAASPSPFLSSPSLAVQQTPTALDPTLTPSPKPTFTPTETLSPSPTPLPDITLLFTGIIVTARCVQAAIDVRGDYDFIYAGVQDLISQADLAIGTLNGTLSEIAPPTGCVRTFVLVGSPGNADAMARAGFDLMSVATNHIKNCGLGNCGDQAFFETLENLRRVGILPVGAGRDHAEAMLPVVVEVQGIRFGFISLGQIEPMAFASDNTPGIAVLNEENLRTAISTARQVSDVVIAMPHWGPEYSPNPNPDQLRLAQVAVEAGADLVVGNHTHVVQAVENIDGIQVFYGLGNFIFDQNWSRETMQSVILRAHFEGTQFTGYELIPAVVEGSGLVFLPGEEETAEILARIETASRSIRR